MRHSIFLTFLLLGIGQNLPYGVYWYGLGAGDGCFAVTLILVGFHPRMRSAFGREWRRLTLPLTFVIAFAGCALGSLFFNAFVHGFAVRDFFELARIGYLMVLMVLTSAATKNYGAKPAVGFALGIVVSGIVAYLNPRFEDVFGTVVVWNPNVIGNMMAVGIIFASLLALFHQRFVLASFVGAVCLAVGAFTLSKGAWLMCVFASVAFATAIIGSRRREAVRYGKATLLLLGLLLVGVIYRNAEHIREIWEFKLATTQLNDTAAEGGTVAQRWGFVLATRMMVMSNPIFGVGMSNFEAVNAALSVDLGDYYWESDNPHSAWLYLLACMGVPAFALYIVFFVLVFRALGRAVMLRGAYRQAYLFSVVTMFVLSGAVMLQLVAGYFFWFFSGIVFAHADRANPMQARPRSPGVEPATISYEAHSPD